MKKYDNGYSEELTRQTIEALEEVHVACFADEKCCLKRRHIAPGQSEFGYVHILDMIEYRYTVYPHEPPRGAAGITLEYDSLDALMQDGWVID